MPPRPPSARLTGSVAAPPGPPTCPVATTVAMIAGRWKPLILWYLRYECRRFGELEARLVAVSHKVLAQQLRELEAVGLVSRSVVAGGPRHVDYALTPLGDTLVPILDLMHAWGAAHDSAAVGGPGLR